jgi:hypothetical protein
MTPSESKISEAKLGAKKQRVNPTRNGLNYSLHQIFFIKVNAIFL